MRKVLLYYSFGFSFGGGEHLPLSFVEELQKAGPLTVALDFAPNFERAARLLGIPLDPERLRVVQVTPPGYDPKRHRLLDSIYRSRQLKKLAREADVCISAGNVMDFGRPGHHFINMLAFGDDDFTAYAMGRLAPKATGAGRKGAAKRAAERALRLLLGMRAKRAIIRDRRERVYPNSAFVEGLMKAFYGPFASEVFYPPTLFEPVPAAPSRDPLKVVYIGRIIPEKRIEDIVDAVGKARDATGRDLTLHVAGRLDQTPSYGRRLRETARRNPWLEFPGPLYGEDKSRFLTSGAFAVHAERDEAFGISVAEYLKAGVVPVVPDEGGAREVADDPDLSFDTPDEAARILARLATDDAFREEKRRRCAARAAFFSRDAYFARQRALLRKITGGPQPPDPERT